MIVDYYSSLCLTVMFDRIGVGTKEDMEKLLHQHSKNAQVREASMELLDVEVCSDTVNYTEFNFEITRAVIFIHWFSLSVF